MNDQHLVDYLRRMDCRGHSIPLIAARRIEELKRELNRANQRIGLFLHYASKKKAKR